jgi:hypothetical protein
VTLGFQILAPMSTLLVNYADQRFYEAQKLNRTTGLLVGGLERAVCYTSNDLDAEFTARNREILEKPIGAGNWLWKPYVVVKALREEMRDGDVLFYADSGSHFMSRAAPVISLCLQQREKPILLFTLDPRYSNRHLIKRDCFHYMGMDKAPYPDMTAILASFIVCQKTAFTVSFFEEWLAFAQDPRILGDGPNECGLPNYPEFFEHRYDQAILSLLARKHAIATVPDISQWGNSHRPPEIPQVIAQTRWKA